jgi:hypothetical protein
VEIAPLVHQQNVRPPGNIGVDGHWKDELVILPVEVIKMILCIPIISTALL